MRATGPILVGPAAHLLMLAIDAAGGSLPLFSKLPRRAILSETHVHRPPYARTHSIPGFSCRSNTACFTNANSGYSATV